MLKPKPLNETNFTNRDISYDIYIGKKERCIATHRSFQIDKHLTLFVMNEYIKRNKITNNKKKLKQIKLAFLTCCCYVISNKSNVE